MISEGSYDSEDWSLNAGKKYFKQSKRLIINSTYYKNTKYGQHLLFTWL